MKPLHPKSSKSPDALHIVTQEFYLIAQALLPNDPLFLIIVKDLTGSTLISYDSIANTIGHNSVIVDKLRILRQLGMITQLKESDKTPVYFVNSYLLLVNDAIDLSSRKRLSVKKLGKSSAKKFCKWITQLDRIRIYETYQKLPQTSRRLSVL